MCREGKRRVHGVRLRWVLMARMLGGIVTSHMYIGIQDLQDLIVPGVECVG
jgi:hypothetical protein